MAYSGPVTDPRPLALAAQVLIAVQTLWQLGLALAGGTRSKLFAETVTFVTMPLFFGVTIVFLCWFRRCSLNAEVFAPGTHRHSRGFVLGAWFIPLVQWWVPRRIALDIWRASGLGGTWLLNAWWVAWLARALVGCVEGLSERHPNAFSLYDESANLVATVLVILVIRKITAAQDATIRQDLAGLPFARTPTV